MKIAITSDYHLGYNADAAPQAEKILAKARQLADVVIAAGDLFDVRVPKQETVNEAAKLFKCHAEQMKGRAAGISKGEKSYEENPVIAIPGTHERRTKGLANVIEVLDSAGVIINCHNAAVVAEKNGEKLCITGMAGVPEEYAVQVVKAMNVKPLAGAFNVFVFHQTLKEVIPMNDKFMTMDDLPPGFDLYVNGHIHWCRELKKNDKLLLIPGSSVITQMRKNETEKKGFWLYDTTTKSYEFVFIDSRPFFYKELVFEDASLQQILQGIEKTVSEAKSLAANPLVKIKLRGSLTKGVSASIIDANSIAAGFSGAEVYIDKEFEMAETLKEKIELLRRLKTEEKSVSELGIAVLAEKLKHNKFSLANEEELFSLLSQGEVEKAAVLVKKS